jgi:hypothetical protein
VVVVVVVVVLAGRRAITEVVKAIIIEVATSATFIVDVDVSVAGVGRLAAAATVVAIIGRKATSGLPDKYIQNVFATVYELTEALFPALWHGA